MPKAADQQAIEELARPTRVQKYVAGQAIKKIIIVPGRLINIVV